jgi:AP-3 complex subunit delta-1
LQLFNFIRADLASHRPPEAELTAILPVDEINRNPVYPKSLLLINPLFSVYELNTVNVAAQDSVPVPESLDLDAWIVPPPREFTLPDAAATDDTQVDERRATRKKPKSKGKGKGKERGSKAELHGPETNFIPSLGPSETEEERAEREKASRSVKLEFQGRHI